MIRAAIRNFMKQQGFPEESPDACNMHFAGLYFQPRIVGSLVVVGIVFHAAGWIILGAALFGVLSAVLWWNVSLPKLNPFEQFYNRVLALSPTKAALAPAPGPRRFAQGVAAAFMLVAAISLARGWNATAAVFEGFLVLAFSALLFGKFCLGAYLYHLLRGEFAFANATLPWARP